MNKGEPIYGVSFQIFTFLYWLQFCFIWKYKNWQIFQPVSICRKWNSLQFFPWHLLLLCFAFFILESSWMKFLYLFLSMAHLVSILTLNSLSLKLFFHLKTLLVYRSIFIFSLLISIFFTFQFTFCLHLTLSFYLTYKAAF